ncbi:hypothetical protein CRG98_028525 [Punica granatum]|uniref:Uncharacterized protein n=1 Tax=Punica granatum TaxID=22663 RepID=A0A2I0J5V9_PUNGR|nr:hypothetical protein CRG98_028525 [Punica granatum]
MWEKSGWTTGGSGLGRFGLAQTRIVATDSIGASSTRLGTQEKIGRFRRLGWLLGECSNVPDSQEDFSAVVLGGEHLYKDQTKESTPRNKPDWASFGSFVTTVAPDGILLQGRRLPTPKRPPEVAIVVV